MFPKKIARKCALISGLLATIMTLGIVIICFRTLIYRSILNKIFVLQPDGLTYSSWKTNPVPLALSVHLFNWTNPADILNSSVKPLFQQMGPYFFDETKEKVNITWNNPESSVTFYHLKRWWFNPSRSNGNITDMVTSVNPIAISSAIAVKNWSFFVKKGLDIFLQSTAAKVHSTHKAGEVLFGGYEDSLLNVANKFPSLGVAQIPNFDKFGWFYTRNNSETYEGEFVMNTGLTGQLGELHFWKGMNATPYYRDHCGTVSGSAGEFFPGNLSKESIIKFFSPDLCRYIELEFEDEVVVNGILGYKYVAGDRFLDNGTKIERNKCFCEGDCMPYGAMNISTCRYGSPAFVSLPHFFKADPHYRRTIEGMEPNKEAHDFFMIFEPKTGMALQVAARLQLNLLVQPVPGISFLAQVPEMYAPVLWFEQTMTLPGDIIFYIKLINNSEAICLAIGMCLIFCPIVCKVCLCYRMSKTKISHHHKVKENFLNEEMPLNTSPNSSC